MSTRQRIPRITVLGSYDSDNRVTGFNPNFFQRDSDGNITHINLNGTQVEISGDDIQLTLDANGRATAITIDGTTTELAGVGTTTPSGGSSTPKCLASTDAIVSDELRYDPNNRLYQENNGFFIEINTENTQAVNIATVIAGTAIEGNSLLDFRKVRNGIRIGGTV